MDRFNIDLYVLVLLSLSITSCLGLDKGIAADSDRLARIEDLLETVINTNKELEKRVKHLETELQEQKVLNDEMLDRIYELEATQRIDTNSEQLERNATTETPDRHNAVNGRSNQAYLWTERNNFPNIKQNHHHGNKRLLDSFQSSPAPSTTSASPTSVAFTAVLTTNLSNLGAGQTIKFNQIVTNVGGCYHPSHGNFIAPSDGVYVFSVTAMAINGHYEHMHIVKDGVGMIAIFGGPLPAGAFESTTVMVTLDLAKGNEVWVQTVSQSWHGSGTMHGAWDVSFSGWRLS